MTVPFASGLATRTTSWTEPEAPAASEPIDQLTTPAESAPPPVADTNVVFTGTVSESIAPVAPVFPVFDGSDSLGHGACEHDVRVGDGWRGALGRCGQL